MNHRGNSYSFCIPPEETEMEYLYFPFTKGHIGIPLMEPCWFVPMPSNETGMVRIAGKIAPIIDLHAALEGRGQAETFEGNLLIISTPHLIALLIDREPTPWQPTSGSTRYLQIPWLALLAQDHYNVYASLQHP